MQDKWQIEPGRGLGSIHFGISKAVLIDMLGEPDEIDVNEEDQIVSEHLYYDDLDVSFTYSSAEGDRLLIITVGNPAYWILDTIHIGMTYKEAIEGIDALGWMAPDIEDISSPSEPNAYIYSYDDQGIDIWFEEGFLSGFQLSPLWQNEDAIAWPEKE